MVPPLTLVLHRALLSAMLQIGLTISILQPQRLLPSLLMILSWLLVVQGLPNRCRGVSVGKFEPTKDATYALFLFVNIVPVNILSI